MKGDIYIYLLYKKKRMKNNLVEFINILINKIILEYSYN
jgi:hypothetical protein